MSEPTTPTRPPLEEMRARTEAATPERDLCERCTKGAHTHIGGSCVLCPCQHPLDCRCGGCEDGRAAARAVVADLPAALDWIAHVEGLLARAVLRVELMPNHGADCGYWASSAGSRTCTCGGNGLAADIRAAIGGGR
jgi:hypothetical protein